MTQPAKPDLVTVNVDGKEIAVPKGTNVIEAARLVGEAVREVRRVDGPALEANNGVFAQTVYRALQDAVIKFSIVALSYVSGQKYPAAQIAQPLWNNDRVIAQYTVTRLP